MEGGGENGSKHDNELVYKENTDRLKESQTTKNEEEGENADTTNNAMTS